MSLVCAICYRDIDKNDDCVYSPDTLKRVSGRTVIVHSICWMIRLLIPKERFYNTMRIPLSVHEKQKEITVQNKKCGYCKNPIAENHKIVLLSKCSHKIVHLGCFNTIVNINRKFCCPLCTSFSNEIAKIKKWINDSSVATVSENENNENDELEGQPPVVIKYEPKNAALYSLNNNSVNFNNNANKSDTGNLRLMIKNKLFLRNYWNIFEQPIEKIEAREINKIYSSIVVCSEDIPYNNLIKMLIQEHYLAISCNMIDVNKNPQDASFLSRLLKFKLSPKYVVDLGLTSKMILGDQSDIKQLADLTVFSHEFLQNNNQMYCDAFTLIMAGLDISVFIQMAISNFSNTLEMFRFFKLNLKLLTAAGLTFEEYQEANFKDFQMQKVLNEHEFVGKIFTNKENNKKIKNLNDD